MTKRFAVFACIGFLVSVVSGLVNSQDWYSSQSYYPRQSYPQQLLQQTGIDIVEGTIDQLNRIDAKWVCTNPKNGDQMIVGTEMENGNTMNNNGYLQQYVLSRNTAPWTVQESTNRQEQVRRCDSSPMRSPQDRLQGRQTQHPGTATAIPVVENKEAPFSPKPLAVEQVRKKFANWDWTQYVTMRPMNNVATASESAKTTASPSPIIPEYDGQGVLEPRFHA